MTIDVAWKDLLKIGSVSLLVAGVLYIVNFAILFASGGLPPTAGEATLRFFGERKALVQTAFIIFFLIDLVLIPGILALYVGLREVNRPHMLIASVLGVVALTADLVNTFVAYALVGLVNAHSAATSDVQRNAYAVAAELTRLITDAGTALFITVFSVAILAISVVMRKSVFGRPVAYLGMATGVLGIVAGLSGFLFLGILWPVWFLAAGAKLYRR